MSEELSPAVWGFMGVLAVAALVACVFNLLALHRVMDAISEGNRPCQGWMIWLTFVPFLGSLWYLAYLVLLSNALQKEMALRGVESNGELPLAITIIVTWMLSLIPFIGILSALVLFGAWVVYWVKMVEYHKKLVGR